MATEKYKKLTIGILAEANSKIFWWQKTRSKILELDAKIIYLEEVPRNAYKRRLANIPSRLLWRLLEKYECRNIRITPQTFQPKDAITLECTFSGHFKDFPKASLNIIRSQKIDLIIRLGGRGIYRGDLLQSSPLGVISIHHGDSRKFRGGPPCFWEILSGASKVGYIIQRLTPKLDGGVILARGEVNTLDTMAMSRASIFEGADEALANVIESLATEDLVVNSCEDDKSLGPIYTMPSVANLIRYVLRTYLWSRRPSWNSSE